MDDIDSKLSAINTKSKEYYHFASAPSYGRLQDEISEAEDEDVDTIVHRYDPPSSNPQFGGQTDNVAKSLADEIKDQDTEISTQHNRSSSPPRNAPQQPPPDLLISSNCRRKIWPQFEDIEDGTINDAFSEDWEMVLELETDNEDRGEVDIVIRDQPSASGSTNFTPTTTSNTENGGTEVKSNFYRNARRLVVHHVQGVEVVKPKCGCCILQ